MKNLITILAAVFLIFLGGVGLWQATKEQREAKLLRETGLETTGEVVDGEYRKRKPSKRYYLKVEFQPEGGEPQSLKERVSEETYEAGKNGGPIKVRYLPGNPKVCAFGNGDPVAVIGFLWPSAMVALGALCLLGEMYSGNPDQIKNDAVNKGEATRKEAYVFAPVNDIMKEYPYVDHEFYERTRKQLEEYGYRFLGDEKITNVKINTFTRYLVSEDGLSYAACFYHKPGTIAGMLGAKECRAVEFCSALTDGTFVNTGNVENISGLHYPELVDTEQLSEQTPVPELISRHRRRVQKHVKAEVQVVEVRTVEEVHRIGNAEQKVKAMWRKNQEIDPRELRTVAREALAAQVQI